jgi:tripartite-type tricarboxylate transporter receptor subunit TctC
LQIWPVEAIADDTSITTRTAHGDHAANAVARRRRRADPDHTLKIVVPSAPAGGYDVIGRLLADQLSKRLGQNVIVENRPGAGTIVGTQFVVDSPADGYALLIGGLSNIVFNAGLYTRE